MSGETSGYAAPPVAFEKVFAEELKVACPELAAEVDKHKDLAGAVDASPHVLSALCLSGGGIRSGVFALGVMQTLAKYGLLGQFHYLSTVSGGGYTGSWLSAWRQITPDATVFAALNSRFPADGAQRLECDEISQLRANSNYITPRLGLLSADTWTVLTLYLRNLLLNWMLFAPFFIGSLLLPQWWACILASFKHTQTIPGHHHLIWGALLALTIGLTAAVYGRFRMAGSWLNTGTFVALVLAPLLVSSICFSLAAALSADLMSSTSWIPPQWLGLKEVGPRSLGTFFGVATYGGAWIVGRLVLRPAPELSVSYPDLLAWGISGGVVGFTLSSLMTLIEQSSWTDGVAVFGVSACVVSYLLGDILYVGLSSLGPHGNMDREWLARASGWLSAVAVLWTVIASVAIYSSAILRWAHDQAAVALSVGGISGILSLFLGSSDKTGATVAAQAKKRLSLIQVAGAAAIVFAFTLAVLLGAAGPAITHWLLEKLAQMSMPSLLSTSANAELVTAVLLILVAFGISHYVNINRFSLHALYRNRLARTFIGAARVSAPGPDPDPFTGFDVNDNVHLKSVVPCAGSRLFHIINATLNVVSSKNLAWQERKAEPFTFSRLFCGNPMVGFQPTSKYGKDLSLATAMAISGAAVSPNQGYNSSALIGFLLMLFNVRLGWWFGNPRFPKVAYKEGPRWGLMPALRELCGLTKDDSDWIYLSDGGHFENLGLYEMVRRRCRAIVISDADCDPTFSFGDLGNAVRKIYIDLGVSIEFESFELAPRKDPPSPGVRFALGEIHYGPTVSGWLLYIKPTYQGTERIDIRSYANGSRPFPHETTADQWFSESQMESYRALGAWIMEWICTSGGKVTVPGNSMTLAGLHAAAMKIPSVVHTSNCCCRKADCKNRAAGAEAIPDEESPQSSS